ASERTGDSRLQKLRQRWKPAGQRRPAGSVRSMTARPDARGDSILPGDTKYFRVGEGDDYGFKETDFQ
ncbi:hypothetical protein WKH24_21645, partial [Pantoea agglomerans]|uniref:hypothetical protein n=1 Tax=Enterobacter agglomerans TaxID=549 RepID=UPI003C7D1074